MTASAPPTTTSPTGTAPLRNGLAIAALCCGLIGILVGLIPLMFLAAGALGILAIVFGIVGIRRVGRGEASNRGMAIAGLVAGIVAFALAIWGISIVFSGLNDLSNELNKIDTGNASAAHAVTHQEAHLIHQSWFVGNQ